MTRLLLSCSAALLALPSMCSGGLVVDNFSEAGVNGFVLRSSFLGPQSTTWAQQFNTGGDDYFLDSIAVAINRDTVATNFTARLWTSSGSLPLASVLNLSLANTPANGSYQTHVFTPDNQFLLDGSTDYFFSIENNIGSNSFLMGTTLGSNNFTGPGTILSNIPSSSDSGQNWSGGSSSEAAFRVDGTLAGVPEPSSLAYFGAVAAACLVTPGRRRRPRPRNGLASSPTNWV